MWTPINKNGIWIWYTTPGGWDSYAQSAGLNYVMVKAGDGAFSWGQFNPGLVEKVHNRGLDCMAWTYCYLDDPKAEAQVAMSAIQNGADGVVLDIEYEAIGKFSEASTLVSIIKNAYPDVFVGYSPDLRIALGNRWPKLIEFVPDAEPFPWQVLNELDGVFPQLYWTDFQTDALQTLELANIWARGC